MSSTNGIGSVSGGAPLVTAAAAAVAAERDQQIKTTAATVSAGSKVSKAVDQTSISSTSELLSAALNASDVRLDRIQPLQQAIADGTYSVPSSDVADKVIGSLLR